jgi:flagellar biogenesis protein FliO
VDLALAERSIGACVVVALVLFGVSAIARRAWRPGLPARRRGSLLAIVETAFLPSAASLHVVRVAERYYAIGRSGAHIAMLCEIPAESVTYVRDKRPALRLPRLWRSRA